MSKPCSNDLRDRVVCSVEVDGLSCRQAASRFGVGVSTVIRWVERFRKTGNVSPGKMGGHRPKKISGAHRDGWSKAFTLLGLVAEMGERGLTVDYRSVWEFVRAEKLSYKERRWSLPNRIAPTSRAGARSG